jgi:hypothetical protein
MIISKTEKHIIGFVPQNIMVRDIFNVNEMCLGFFDSLGCVDAGFVHPQLLLI